MSETKASKEALKKEQEAKEWAEAGKFAAFYVRVDHSAHPAHSSVGVHGYVCNTVVAKKGYGLKGVKTTPNGYLKESAGEQTNVLEITDIRFYKAHAQNEIGMHLAGISVYLENLLKSEHLDKLLTVRFVASAGQLKDLIESGLDYLAKHDFKNKQGVEAPYKDEVIRVHALIAQVKEKGIEFKAVLDTDDKNVGFGIARCNAAMALTKSIKTGGLIAEADIDTVPPEKYWNYSATRHPFFNKSRQIVVTNHPAFGADAKFHYLLDFEQVSKKKDETHKREIEVGQRLPSSALSVARMKETSPIHAAIYDEHCKYTPYGEQRMGVVFLGEAYSPNVHRMLERTGGDYLRPHGRVLNLLTPGQMVLTHELFPPRQAFRLLENMHELQMILERSMEVVESKGEITEPFLFNVAGYGDVSITDVTSAFYDKLIDEKGKEVYKLAKAVDIPNTKVLLDTVYPSLKDPSQKQRIDAAIGIDTPVRNAMAAMAAETTRVYLTTAIVSEKLIAYQTIFVFGGDAAIFSGHYCRYVYSL